MFSLLKPTFSLLLRPRPLTLTLQSTTERSPTDYLIIISFLISRYYALFKGLLLLSKPPGCLSLPTSFAT